jgi:hypothetical protein
MLMKIVDEHRLALEEVEADASEATAVRHQHPRARPTARIGPMRAVLYLLPILDGLILLLVSSHRRWQQLTERERFFLAMKSRDIAPLAARGEFKTRASRLTVVGRVAVVAPLMAPPASSVVHHRAPGP